MTDRTSSARYFAALVVIGVGASLFAAGFRALLGLAFGLAGATDVVGMIAKVPIALRITLPAAGGLCAGLIVRALRGGGGGGVGSVMEAVVLGRGHLSIRRTLLTSLGSWLAIVSGGSIGREGPLIQFGGAFGGLAARVFRIDAERGRALMAAGTAAGFAAAYNTPLAAVLFVLEIVTGVVAIDAIAGAVIATALGTTLTRAIVGGGPIYGQRAFAPASAGELGLYAVLGLFAALGAWAFMQLLAKGEALFARSRLPQPWRAALGGLLVGLLATRLPEISGNGYEPLNAMLDGTLPLSLVAALLVAKAIATTSSVSSGSPGGVFTPTLFLGAALGVCFHAAATLAFGSTVAGPGAYALVGMAATTAATTRAPMMAAVLVFELSGDYAIVLPVMLATATATLLSRVLREDSIYGAELRKRGFSWDITLEGRQLHDVRDHAEDSQ